MPENITLTYAGRPFTICGEVSPGSWDPRGVNPSEAAGFLDPLVFTSLVDETGSLLDIEVSELLADLDAGGGFSHLDRLLEAAETDLTGKLRRGAAEASYDRARGDLP